MNINSLVSQNKFAFLGLTEADIEIANKIENDLIKAGGFLESRITTDDDFQFHYDSGYRNFIVLLSKNTLNSNHFLRNILGAKDLKAKIVLIRVDDFSIPEIIGQLPLINIQDYNKNGVKKLISAFKFILWVDDNPDNNISARNFFESNGYNVVISTNSEEAINALLIKKYIAVISDMGRLEGPAEGYNLLDKIRETDKEIPFFIHAGSSSPEHRYLTHSKGGNGTTNSPTELFEMVSSHLQVVDLIENNFESKNSFLDLGNCGLTNFSNIKINLEKLTHLNSLSLGSEYFDESDKLIFTNNSKPKNNFTNIPTFIPAQIKFLQIRDAGITKIDNLEANGNHEYLDLSLNQISLLENLEKLTNLKELALHGNSITKIQNLDSLKKLEILHLTRNKIEKIEGLDSLINLSELYLSVNQIRVIENLETNLKLKILDINSNAISRIENLNRLIQLENLNFTANNISKIEGLNSLKKIKNLAFANNKIKEIENLESLVDLESLIINHNEIGELKGLNQLQKLKILLINNNNISKLKPFAKLTGLKVFSIDKNPIIDIPADIWQSNDVIQIKAYFNTKINKNLSKSTKDVKLILLGNSNVGKTNLVHYLETGQFLSERKSTHGLEVRRWKPDITRFPLLENINVSIWDFGGQEYYHDAYKLFLSANAVYLVLWEKNTDSNSIQATNLGTETKEIEHFEKQYWLETVKNTLEFTESPPLYIIQNKVDFPRKDIERLNQELFDNYGIKESHHLSIKEGCEKSNENYSFQSRLLKNFESELELILLEKAGKAENDENWELIKNEIIKYQEGVSEQISVADVKCGCYLEYDDFIKISQQIAENVLTKDELHTLPRWLDACGVIIYFPQNEALRNKVFINPKKLSEQIYNILGVNILDLNGEFERKDLNNTNANFLETFIETTLNLGLIFHHPVKPNAFLAPQYFPKEHPIEDLFKIASNNIWKDSYILKLPIFFYKKLLNHLILYFIKDETTVARYYWKYGIVLLKNDIRVLIKGLYPEDKNTYNSATNTKKDGEKIIISVQEGLEKSNVVKEIFKIIFEFTLEKGSNSAISTNLEALTSKMASPLEKRIIRNDNFLEKLSISNNDINFYTYYKLYEIKNLNENDIKELSKNMLSVYSELFPEVKLKQPKKVFLSYSHQNTAWLNKLRIHFSGLKRSNLIDDWTDQEILPGEKWDKNIKDKMESADIFICLLTADFIASEYIWNVELNQIFKKLKNNFAQIIFVYCEPFDLGSIKEAVIKDDLTKASILDFELIPKENELLKPLSEWANVNMGLAQVVKDIRSVIENYNVLKA